MFWRWRPLRRDGRIDPFTLTAAYVALFSLFLSLSSSLFLLLFPCLDNLLPHTPYTYSLDLRLFPCSFSCVPYGHRLPSFSSFFYSFASIAFRSAYSLIFVEMLFTERSKNQRKILERWNVQVDFERCLTQINGVWSCHVLSYALYSMGRSFRDAGHISDCDRNSFMGTWLMTYGGAIRTCITG